MKKILFAALLLAASPLSFVFADASSTPDVTPPVISAPSDQIFATTTFPASPTLVLATAIDNVDPNPAITYSPLTFPIGTTTVLWTATDASGNFATTTSNVIITDSTPPTPVVEHATLSIRDGSTLVGPFTIDLPDTNAPDVLLTATGTTTAHAVPARSVLALLTSLDATSSSFDITDLQYFNSFSSFIINCISVPAATSSPQCSNWTYAVNGIFPATGMDKNVLQNGDTAYIIFGSQWQVSTDKSSVSTGESFTATAQEYDPSSNTYLPASGLIVGAVQFDSNFHPTEFATSTTDVNGHATLSLANAGSYAVGIQQTGYFPNVPVTVSAPQGGGGGGGGGGGSPITHTKLNIPAALAYIVSKQRSNGSFDSDNSSFYSDWVAIALAATTTNDATIIQAKSKLKDYLLTATPPMTHVTDYERHAMALSSLGINPYTGTGVDYITPIVNSFDGTQIGDPTLDNDDIFAIFPLLNSGYAPNNPMMKQIASSTLSKQKPDGSWDESPDMTVAALETLGDFFGPSGVDQGKLGQAFGMAAGYLVSSEGSDGSWGSSVDSTSWVQMMINSVNAEDPVHASNWASSAGYYPTDAIARAQQTDGAVRPSSDPVDTRVWSTSYAITAASGGYWMDLLQFFPKPPHTQPSGGGSGGSSGFVLGASTSTTATSTLASATSTGEMGIGSGATSTAPQTIGALATTSPHVLKKVKTKKTRAISHPQLPTPHAPLNIDLPQESQTAAASPNFMNTALFAVVRFFAKIFSFF